MNRTIVDLYILQTVPPSNMNRDDTGSPKTALFGGVRRARVSSQAWKRATRVAFEQRLDSSELGVRTKRVVELLGERILALAPDLDEAAAQSLAKQALMGANIKSLAAPRKSTKEQPLPDESGYLLFLSSRQYDQLAEAAVEAFRSDDAAASFKAAKLKERIDTSHSVDIALFGRMVADSSDLNVDASAQVAHAISVHEVETEFDYFTAVDDHKRRDEEEDAGAGMIGTVEFNSSTLYRYATVDADLLLKNLGSVDATRRAVEAFTDSFARSLPTGKQNTFANRTLPDAVVAVVRDSQPVNLVGAFEEPVASPRLRTAGQRLAEHATAIEAKFGVGATAAWVVAVGAVAEPLAALGQEVSLDELVDGLGEVVSARLTESA